VLMLERRRKQRDNLPVVPGFASDNTKSMSLTANLDEGLLTRE
jgi:hypothetical protein